jgi:hypothetical protein
MGGHMPYYPSQSVNVPKEADEEEDNNYIEGGKLLVHGRGASSMPIGNNVKTVPFVNLQPEQTRKNYRNLRDLSIKGKGVKRIKFTLN